MRLLHGFGMTVVLLAVAVPSAAAPVPKATVPPADAERLWKECAWSRDNTAEAVCRLLAEPESAVAFLRKKMPQLTLTKDRAAKLIAALGSEKEAEWRAAYDEMRVLDPRLAMDFPGAWGLAETHLQRARLACLIGGEYQAGWELYDIRLKPPAPPLFPNWHLDFKRLPGTEKIPLPKNFFTGVGNLHLTPEHVGGYDHEWSRYLVGVRLLERIDSAVSRRLLDELALGHPDASPTKAANAARARLKKGNGTPARVTFLGRDISPLARWEKWFWDTRLDSQLDVLFEYLDRPKETVASFRQMVRPVKLDGPRADALLADLFGNDESKWKAAVHEFNRADVRLVYPPKDVWAMADTDAKKAKAAMILVMCGGWIVDDFFRCDLQLTEPNPAPGEWDAWTMAIAGKPGLTAEQFDRGVIPNGSTLVCADIADVNLNSGTWGRDTAALWVLGRIGTADAFAVVRAVSEGHPKARPTVAAKAVLAHFGRK